MSPAELRALVRRVTMRFKDGRVLTIDTLAHENRQTGIGRAFDSPVSRFTQDGVAFRQTGSERPEITVEEIPEGQEHSAYRVRSIDGRDGEIWII